MQQPFIKTICLSVLMTIFAAGASAQFNISAEFRPRFEYRDGYARLRDSSQTPYFDILGRNRLIFDYKNERFMAKFSIQHAYTYGENNYSSDTITRNTINIYEGWFKYNFTKWIGIKIGRMELIYDDSRLLGNSNWGPRGATHDLALVQWEVATEGYRGDFGFAINNTAPPGAFMASYPLINYKYMSYLYEQKKFLKDKLTFSVIALLDVFQKGSTTTKTNSTRYDTLYVTNINHDTIGTTVMPTTTTTSVTHSYPDQLYGRFTFGGTAGYTSGKLKLFFAGYYQSGHFKDGRKLNAGYYGGYASYKILKPFTLLVGYERLSGNDYSDTEGLKTKSTSFSVLYPTSHSFYGYMDMFAVQVISGNSAGLTDLYAKGTLVLGNKTSLEATYRMFGLAKGYLPAAVKKPGDLPYAEVGKNLGSEVDLMVIYKPVPNFEINAAYCFFLPTATMERLNGLNEGTSKWAQYAYVMLTYKPNFFNSEKH